MKKGDRTVARFSPAGARLATAGRRGEVRLWDVHTGQSRRLAQIASGVKVLRYAPDGQLLAAADGQGIIHLIRPADGVTVRRLDTSPQAGVHAGLVAGRPPAGSGALGQVGMDPPGDHAPRAAAAAVGWHALALSNDGAELFAAGWGRTITVFRADDLTVRRTLVGHETLVYGMGLSPAGRLLLSKGMDRRPRWQDYSDQPP